MKSILKLSSVFFLTILFLLTGCQDLDFPSPNAPVVENVPDQVLISGALAGMRTDLAIYLRSVGSVGREVYYFEPADPRYSGNLLTAKPDPGGFLVQRPWTARYRVILNCNTLIERAGSRSGAGANGLIGFAKTIKAYQLLMNISYMWSNGVKIIQSDDINTPVATLTASLAEINKLLDEANTALGNAGDAFEFSLTSGFAGFDDPVTFATFNRALRARTAAYAGDWDGVLTALANSFLDVTAQLTDGVYHVYGTSLGDQTNEMFETPTASFVKLMAHPSFQADAEAGDERFASKVQVRDLDVNGVPDTTKFDDLVSTMAVTITNSNTDNLPIIRNEELILLRAEANIQKELLPAAQTDINLIRAAYGLGAVTLTDKAQATTQLLHERRYSLFMEGHRWVDMRRYDRLDQLPVDRDGDAVLESMPLPESEIPD